MRFSLVAALVAGLVLPATPATANPTADMQQMAVAFAGVKSFHCEMKAKDGTISMDVIMPDKVHETMFNGMQMIMIGSDVWMYTSGRWMKMPVKVPQFKTMMDKARSAGLNGAAKDYTITYLGPAVVQGVPTSQYRMVGKDNKPLEMWIGRDHLPVQYEMDSDQGPMYIAYSKYNAVPDITPPI